MKNTERAQGGNGNLDVIVQEPSQLSRDDSVDSIKETQGVHRATTLKDDLMAEIKRIQEKKIKKS